MDWSITRSSKDNLSIYWHNQCTLLLAHHFCLSVSNLKIYSHGKNNETITQLFVVPLYLEYERKTPWHSSLWGWWQCPPSTSRSIHCRKTSPLVSPSPAPNSSKAARLQGGVCLSWTLNVTVPGFIWKSYEFMNICIHIHANLYIYMNIYTFNYLYK